MSFRLLPTSAVLISVLLAGCQSATSPAGQAAPPAPAASVGVAKLDSSALPTQAAETDKCTARNPYDIPAGRFDETAQQLAHATGCFIEADLPAIGATPVAAVRGTMTLREALVTALKGTSLVVVATQPNQLKVVRQ